MTRRLWTTVWRAMVLLVTLLCGVTPHDAARAGQPMIPLSEPSPADRDVVLPAGFAAAVDRATSDQFVRVAAGDVDRDGDIDVVASLGSLDLIVWTNDGAGHFTRLPSSQRPSLQTQPPAPAVDGDSLASNEWIQNDRGTVHVALLGPIVDAAPRAAVAASINSVTPQSGPRARSSRAPPLA
jgi:hypothetical protein